MYNLEGKLLHQLSIPKPTDNVALSVMVIPAPVSVRVRVSVNVSINVSINVNVGAGVSVSVSVSVSGFTKLRVVTMPALKKYENVLAGITYSSSDLTIKIISLVFPFGKLSKIHFAVICSAKIESVRRTKLRINRCVSGHYTDLDHPMQ
jgi:hypothetical protein